MSQRKRTSHSQQGMMLMMLMFILGLAATGFVLSSLNKTSMQAENDRKTAEALSLAKALLIGRSVNNNNHPGSLPCPDANNDGSVDGFVGPDCPSYIGRFPWKTFGSGLQQDWANEPLWYALSPIYRENQDINGAVAGDLDVDGAADQVAIIFSPGRPLAGQGGRPSNNVTDYLEGANADGNVLFTQQQSQIQNDRLMMISRTDLMNVVSQRILREVAGSAAASGLRKYYIDHGNNFPFADSDGDGFENAGVTDGKLPMGDLIFGDAMLTSNGWLPPLLSNYSITVDRQQATVTLHGKTITVTP